jgi:hypothetical protein
MPMREGRRFQWWRLRWYWPERKAAGKPYKMRLLYTGRTVMRMTDTIESLNRIIDVERAGRVVDVSDVDGVLAGFRIQDDGVELELACTTCPPAPGDFDGARGKRICSVDDGDEMDTLVRACLAHEHEED